MPIITKELSGQMDLDSPNETIPHNMFREAWNGRLNGPKGNEKFEALMGNQVVPGQSFLPTGTNKTIGRFEDAVNSRIFYFNYNSNNNHGIYVFNTNTGIFQTLIIVGAATDGDILGFTAGGPIDSIDIIYGDPQEGDLLCFVDSLGRPTKLNIQRYLANTYTFIPRSYLNVIKAPPEFPPHVVYENDTTVNNNNLLNSLFKFAVAYVYDDNDQSVLSSGSRLALPVHTFSNTTSVDKSLDSRIAVFFNTGPSNVHKIVIYMKQVQNGATSDWLIVDTIDKTSIANPIIDNTTYKYNFYNDGNYVPEDTAYTTQLFDYVPDEAGCQCLLNGNVLCYGNIVEGYDWIPSYISSQQVPSPLGATTLPGFVFFASKNGKKTGTQDHYALYISGAGTNDPNGTPITITNNAASALYFNAVSDSNDVSFFTGISGDNIQSYLTLLSTAAAAAGWVVVGQGVVIFTGLQNGINYLEVYYPTGSVHQKSTYATGHGGAADTTTRLAHYPSSSYAYGVVYFDKNGKSNGVITNVYANIKTLPVGAYSGFLYAWSSVTFNLINVTPPDWASTYAIVRTDTLTYSKYLDWISNQAFSNVGQLVDNQYAYLGISNIDDFNEGISASQQVVSYGYTQGDRVRITACYDITGQPTYGLTYDYPVLSLEIDPIVNGLQQKGRFVKIAYPTADVGGNLRFDGDYNFQNYAITLYNIADSSSPQTSNSGSTEATGNVYYEMGMKFGIGNQGLATSYHYGNAGDNKVTVQDGDVFFRKRIIPAGNTYYIYVSSTGGGYSNRYITPKLGPSPSTITTPSYTISAQANLAGDAFNGGNYPKFSDSGGLFLNTSGGTLNLRLRGSFQVSTDSATWMDILLKMDAPNGTTVLNPFLLVHSDGIGTNESTTITFDGKVAVPNGYKVWLILGNGETTQNLHVNGFMLRLDIVKNISIQTFSPSYSDIYQLVTNSDNRPNVAQPDAKRLQYGSMYRWGQEDQLNSSRNNSNRFYFVDYDEATKAYGNLVRLVVTGKMMYVFQAIKCGTVGIFQKWIKNNTGSDELIVNDTLIQKNNIRYEIYEGGIGNQGGSVVVSNYAHYFVDPSNGYILRWSRDGVTIISLLYKSQTWAGQNLPNYQNSYTYQFGGDARILGTFKIVKDNNSVYYMMAQGGTNAAGATIPGLSLRFDESDNGFEGFANISADQILTAGNTLYTWYGGVLYSHDNGAAYSNFYGVQYPVSITLVWNEDEATVKKFKSLRYQSNRVWVCQNVGDVMTSAINPQTGLQQISQLIAQDASRREGLIFYAFLKDANSMLNPQVALLEGDYLYGNWIETKLSYTGPDYTYIYVPKLKYAISNNG